MLESEEITEILLALGPAMKIFKFSEGYKISNTNSNKRYESIQLTTICFSKISEKGLEMVKMFLLLFFFFKIIRFNQLVT